MPLRAGWAVVIAAIGLAGCGRPVVYPRSAHIAKGVHLGLQSNVSHGDAVVRLEVPDTYEPAEGEPTAEEIEATEYTGHTSAPSHSFNTPLRVLGILWSAEGQLAYAPAPGFALGGWLGLQQSGLEARGQLLDAPFAWALSAGALTPSLVGDDGVGVRFGTDLSKRFDDVEVILGGYGSWGPRQRNMKAEDFPDDGEGHIFPGEKFGVTVLRREWKLTIPLGVSFRSETGAVVLGIVPELTLDADLRQGECTKICGPASLASYEQSFALYLTLGAVRFPRGSVDGGQPESAPPADATAAPAAW